MYTITTTIITNTITTSIITCTPSPPPSHQTPSGGNKKNLMGQNLLKAFQKHTEAMSQKEWKLHLMLETELGSVTITQVILVLKV